MLGCVTSLKLKDGLMAIYQARNGYTSAADSYVAPKVPWPALEDNLPVRNWSYAALQHD
jgi:hypothetical protein